MNIYLNRRGGRVLAAGVAAAGLLALPALPAGARAGLPEVSAQLARAPYLTDLTQTSVQVNWATTRQSAGVATYGPPGACTAHTVTSAALGSPISVNGTTEYQNSVTVTGLSAATRYCYRIATGGASPADLLGRAPSPQFTTLEPAAGRKPLTFDVMDDWGDTTNSGVNNGAINRNQAAIDAEINTSGAQFLISIGDTAYQDGSQTNYGDLTHTGPDISAVFGRSYWAAPGQHIPVFQGNGDHGQNKTVLGVWPEAATTAASGGQDAMLTDPSVDDTTTGSYPTSYYAFSTGGVRFYILDAAWGYTNVGDAGDAGSGACGADCAMYQVDHDQHWTKSSAEYRWLAQDLAAHRGGLKFAFFHFPLYSDTAAEPSDRYLDNTPGSTGSLEQLLHDNGVDLAFNGHAHDYQRNIAGPGGVTSYVTGGGGGSASGVGSIRCSTTDAYAVGWIYGSRNAGTACGAAATPTSDAQVYQFLKVTVNGRRVTVTPTDAQGQTFDVHAYDFTHDTTPPSAPGGLSATQPAPGRTVLTWSPATDNIGVSAYDIYRNGNYLATVGPGVTSYTDASASPGDSYTYRITARDLAGNATSASVDVSGGSPGDHTPPTAPTGLTATSVTAAQVNLAWTAPADTVGVVRYAVLRGGTDIGSASTTGYADDTVAPGTSYAYQIVAYDAAGNASAPSQRIQVTTPSGPPVFSDGFESGTWSQWATVDGLTVQPALVHTGHHAAAEQSTGRPTYAYATLPGSYTDLQGQAWVSVASRTTSASLFGFRSDTGGSIVSAELSPTGRLAVRNNIGGVTTTSTTALAAGGWHLVTLHAVIDGAASRITVSLDGVPVPGLALTGQDLGTRPVTAFQLGDTSTGHSYDIALDDVSVTPGS